MSVRVLGAMAVAGEFAAAASMIRDGAAKDAVASASNIVSRWQAEIPTGSGYEGAGFTGSPGANRVAEIDDGPRVGAEAVNWSFVASFLQSGTAHHGPKVDLLGAADGYIEEYVAAVADRAGL